MDHKNPFAPPAANDDEHTPKNSSFQEGAYTREELKQITQIANGALSIPLCMGLTFSCLLTPIVIALVPLAAVRLVYWFSLRRRFQSLRQPTSFSPNVEVELKFADAGPRYLFMLVVGVILLAFAYWLSQPVVDN